MPILYGRTSSNITLQDALSQCAEALSNGSDAVALLYSPTFCQFAKVQQDGTFKNSKGELVALGSVFEARAFNKNCELRWLNKLDGKGIAVLLSSPNFYESINFSNEWSALPELSALDIIEQSYILWGKGFEHS